MSTTSLVRKGVKIAALPTGVLRPMRPGDLVILLYHSVGAGTGEEIDMPSQPFEDHLGLLRDGGSVCSLDDALAQRERAHVVVTFDDGFADFHAHALPLLVRYGIPAILFLATGLVVEEGNNRTGPERGMTWSQLREATSTGLVTVGSHTHGHTDLSRTTERVAEEEMRRSKELIEDRLGAACSHFAYPWAVGSAEADGVARRMFDSASLGWSTNRAGRLDRHRLGRTPVLRNDGRLFFRAKVRGRLDAEALAYRMLRRGPWRRR